MQIGINQSCIMQARLEQFLDACSDAGIRQVELRTPKLQEAHYHSAPAQIGELLRHSDITVTAINSLEDFGLVPDDSLPILRREVETMATYCRSCDCSLVVAPVARWFEPEIDREWVAERTACRLRFIADILGESGVEVGLEPIAYDTFTVWSLEAAADIIDRSGAKNVSLVADVYNLVRGKSTVDSMRRFGRRISMIHLNDAPHSDFDQMDLVHAREFPGDGVLDPAAWVHAAREGGFNGPLSIEIFPRRVWEMETSTAARVCATKCRAFEAQV